MTEAITESPHTTLPDGEGYEGPDYGQVLIRPDGSYVIRDGTYHVPDIEGFHEEFTQVQAYARRFPERVTPEPQPEPYVPTEEELAEALRRERDRRMQAFEWRLARYERQTRLGQEPEDDLAVLDAYMRDLADLPTRAGFPWDGGGPATPWPQEPR